MMSLITLVATKELISIMSDGRLCEGDKVYQEDFKKIAMISDNIVLGATGNHEEAKSLLANCC
ncbi:hypothetical protein [Salipaludibacillus neizhouensis]|nr:hypothetical protein [Salipaludibacillus neizhouensis]